MEGYTNFTKVHADEFNADAVVGTTIVSSKLSGSVISTNTITKADSYSLSASEIAKFVTSITMSDASKVLTLGLAAGQTMIVYNAGSETVSVKNVAGDTGTSVATTKAVLVIGSATANASIVIALN